MNQISRLQRLIPFHFFYLFFLIMMAFGLSTGNALMSIATIGLSSTWLVEADFIAKWNRIKAFKYAPLVATVIFFVHLLWMVGTEDTAYGWKDIVLKLPLLSIPIVMGSMPKLSTKNWWTVIIFFIAGLLVASLAGLYIYVQWDSSLGQFDGRNLSVFISHIRLALLIGLALFILLYATFNKLIQHSWLLLILVVYFLLFIRLMESGTGYIVVLFVFGMAAYYLIKKIPNKSIKVLLLSTVVSAFLLIGVYVYTVYRYQTEVRDTNDLTHLDSHTSLGNPYTHDVNRKWLENGNYIWIYISFEECEQAWNERSELPFSGKDHLHQPIFGTLFRYLTSKGLRKDYQGVYALSDSEIIQIENGITTCVPPKTGFTARLERIIFELVNHQLNHNPNGHSVVQRILFTKAGIALFNDNWLFGVGTGDGPNAFQSYYESINSPLYKENRLRSHNQFLTLLINLGVVGFALSLLSLVYPLFALTINAPIFKVFLGLVLISFFVDDTLETQAGVCFFVFFFNFLLYQNDSDIKTDEK